MYNEERKMKFMTDTRRTLDFGKSIFNTTAPYEQKAGMDLCELPAEDLQEIANKSFGSRMRTTTSTIAFLRAYVVWCKEQGFETGEGIFNVEAKMEDKTRRYMVASPKHLQSILDKAFAPVESGRVDCIYRCFLWMAFSGLEETDAIDVKVDEINFGTMLIEHNGKSFEIYREAVPAFKMACEATTFMYRHPLYDDEIQRDRFPGEYLLRGIRSDKITLNTVRGWVRKAFKNSGVETSYSKVRLSGLFYKAYEMERFGEAVNFDDAVTERIAKSEHGFHRNYTETKLTNNIRKDLLNDYACWKAAFTG